LEDRCKEGLCQGAALLCSDTQSACASATCQKKSGCVVTTQPNQPCQDGNQCTNDDVCTEDGCVGQTAETCACKDDGECALYDDQDLCTGTVRCIEGSCQVDPTTVVTCPLPGAPCITLYCAPETGLCVPSFPVGPCTDGDLCTENDTCDNGVCKADPLVCDDGDECTIDSCVPSIGCVVEHLPDCVPQKCQDGMHGLCGACGIRTCVGDTWGPCEGEKSCKAGTTDTGACGNCGERTRTCQPWCEWDEWSECQNEKTCMPLTTDTQSCGVCANHTRTCTDNCEWGEFAECISFGGGCEPDQVQDQECGNCGSQSRTCTEGCEWNDWGGCQGEGSCSPDQTDSQGCADCGTQTRTCGGDCQWGGWGGCENQGGCPPDPPSNPCSGCLEGQPNCQAWCQSILWDTGTCGDPQIPTPGHCCACGAPSPPVASGKNPTGHIDDVVLENGHYLIRGWACYPGWNGSIRVDLYLGGPAGSGQGILANYASNPNEDAVNSACGVTGGKHRFQFKISASQWSGYSGQGVYVHTISPVGDDNNPYIGEPGFTSGPIWTLP